MERSRKHVVLVSAVIVPALLFCAGTVFAQATKPTTAETAAFRSAVDTTFAIWCDSTLHPDLDRFLSIWDENAVKMANGKATVYGATRVRDYRQKVFSVNVFDRFEVKIEEYQLPDSSGGRGAPISSLPIPKPAGIRPWASAPSSQSSRTRRTARGKFTVTR